MMMDIRRCYDILDVPLEASAEDINRHHRDLVNIWHPDRFLGNPRLQEKAEQKLSEINAAYDAVIGFLDNPVGFIEKTVDKARNKMSGKTPKSGVTS